MVHVSLDLMHERIVRLFRERFGTAPEAVIEVAGDGSARSYWRLVGPDMQTAIGAAGPDREENEAFFSYTRVFRDLDLPVPEIYGIDAEAGVWLEEDLGDTTLFDALALARHEEEEHFPESALDLYRRAVELLPRFQVEGGRAVDYSVAYPRKAFDRQSILWDLNYFKYHFLKLAHVPFNESRLERDFRALTRHLLQADTGHFLYRDFQSRNIMIEDGSPRFIDYQGGRRGALQYDVASLLYDAKADLPPEGRERILEHYLDALEEHVPVDREEFRRHLEGYVLVRLMQAMGAYGYRGFFERKPRFLQSVPYAARNLASLLEEGLPVELPELERAFERIVEEWAAPPRSEGVEREGLVVTLRSFSYKRGIPKDEAGHGGGFVFDCRALPNPGRHLRYEAATGHDREVVAYLEEAPEVEAFWEKTRQLVDSQVQEYLRRGFDSLTVTYGCTGGQHRSVYFVERLSAHLRGHFPEVSVDVEHRERRHWARAESQESTSPSVGPPPTSEEPTSPSEEPTPSRPPRRRRREDTTTPPSS